MVRATISRLFFFLTISGFYFDAKARHISGGNITYECLGSNKYKFTVKLYRDCIDPQAADFDSPSNQPTDFLIFNLDNNTIYDNIPVGYPTVTDLQPTLSGCISQAPTDFCLQEGVYTFTKTLPVNNKGYIIAYERCCRNAGVVNVSNSGDDGIAIFVKLTKAAMQVCNQAPVFNVAPPNYVCINSFLDIDFSAKDADGDRLEYSLYAPFISGSNPNNVQPGTTGPVDFPPFDTVTYVNNVHAYTSGNPLGTGSGLTIDPLTGKITGVPQVLGLFTIGVLVKEYRGNTLLSETYRDFQIRVNDCKIIAAHPFFPIDPKKGSSSINGVTIVCNGRSIQFHNPGSKALTYNWDFGDLTTVADVSSDSAPTYIYADTGFYKVRLIVHRSSTCSDDTGYLNVRVYDPVRVRPVIIPNCPGNPNQFIDSSVSTYNDINSWKWRFTATDSAITKNAAFTYPAGGTYNISLLVGTTRGCLVQKDTFIKINPKPVANFISNYLCYQHDATFTDASTISSGSITKYNWYFGDGTPTDTLKNTTHTYAAFADSFAIKHVVISAFGCADTIIKKIKVDDTAKIGFTATPSSLCEKSPVLFTNTTTGGGVTKSQWIINNGTPVVNQTTTSVTFPASGTFPVYLVTTNRCGNDTLKSSVKINPDPVVNLGADVTVCNKSTKTLTAAGAFDSIRWSTGETTANISLDGTKTPIYIKVYKNGCEGKDTVTVQKQTIIPNFTNDYLCLNKAVTFVNTSKVNIGTLTQFDWLYGDGIRDNNIQNPTHTYTTFKDYPVELIAYSSIGCSDTFTKTVKMDTVLNVNFNTVELVTCQRKQVDFTNLTKGGFNNNFIWSVDGKTFTTKDLSYTFLGTGLYPVKLVASSRCSADSLTKNFQIRPRPEVYIGRDTVLCKNQSATYTVNKSLYDSIRWVNGSTAAAITDDGSINPLKIKVYVDQCPAEDTVNVTAQRFNLNFSNTYLCYKTSVLFNNISTINTGTIINFSWNFGDGLTANNVKNPTHSYTVFGAKNVTLYATSNTFCMDTLVKNIVMDDTVHFSVQPAPSDICIGQTVQYTNQSTGGNNTTYTWTLNDANPQSTSTATYTYNTIGAQILKLIASNRCSIDTAAYPFAVKPVPQVTLDESVVMCPDVPTTISAKGDFDSVFWSNGTTVNPTTIDGNMSPVIFTGYKYGCKSIDSIKVILNCDVYIPTAFTPNGDNVNDVFNLMPNNIVSYDLRIYNRWGELVFETSDMAKSWDGNLKGEPCPVDDYVYYATGVKKDNKTFTLKGTFTLLR